MEEDKDVVKVKVFKYDPDNDEKPHYESYEVPYRKDMRVLDALDYIVEELGHSIGYRWFCGVKKCGTCATMVNGRPTLTCWEPARPEMVIEPLHNFPIIRDLVVDREGYDEVVAKMKPFLQRSKKYSGFPEPLKHEEMLEAYKLMDCVECLLCVSECPAVEVSSREEFVGPASLVQLAKVALDPRDGGKRAELAVNEGGIHNCVSCYACSEACPNGINVLEDAIDKLRSLSFQGERKDGAKHVKHIKEFSNLVEQNGIVNPAALFVRTKGFSAITSLPLAMKMGLKGKLSLGRLRTESIPHVEEVAELFKLTGGVK